MRQAQDFREGGVSDSPEDKIVQLMREIEELRQALTGRTVSCDFCNQAAKERDEAIKECDEINDVMLALYHKLAAAIEEKENNK